jgi:uncharacterized protein (DUF1697 family)
MTVKYLVSRASATCRIAVEANDLPRHFGGVPLVVLLKGVNVGGHRTFRPRLLADQLRQYGAVNLGAAGTFVIRERVSRARLRAEVARRLPFEAEIMICDGTDVARFTDSNPFAGQRTRPNIIRFTSILARPRKPRSRLPLTIPAHGRWSVKILGCQDRFVFGVYRREMKAIGHLVEIEKLFGIPVTTRQWSTMLAIGTVLKNAPLALHSIRP